jgi:hypothetical protein
MDDLLVPAPATTFVAGRLSGCSGGAGERGSDSDVAQGLGALVVERCISELGPIGGDMCGDGCCNADGVCVILVPVSCGDTAVDPKLVMQGWRMVVWTRRARIGRGGPVDLSIICSLRASFARPF